MKTELKYESLDEAGGHISLLLKGAPGSGKTWKASHFPNPVIINFDNNVRGLLKLPTDVRQNIKIIDPRICVKDGLAHGVKTGSPLKGRLVWDNFIEILNTLVDDDSVKTIVIDSLTTAQEYLMDKILGTEDPAKQMELQNWGALSRYWKTFGEEVLCTKHGKHIVVIAHERKIEQRDKPLTYGLNMGGSMKDSFDVYFTDVWRCIPDLPNQPSQPVRYMVATVPRPTYEAKASINVPAIFEWDKEKDKILAAL